MFLNSLGEGHQHPTYQNVECPVAAPCKSCFLIPLGSTINMEFEPANGRKFPSNQLAYLAQFSSNRKQRQQFQHR
ncbi:hypothetical protein A2U01_0085825 [Trifolium medium]|uniref:Uncharacterized protein n=1 Tax=Trifolium medium TaxID=97028 RepID=A0A392TVU7_9FABA|nr:hypothetical protein [Trifolium medium]